MRQGGVKIWIIYIYIYIDLYVHYCDHLWIQANEGFTTTFFSENSAPRCCSIQAYNHLALRHLIAMLGVSNKCLNRRFCLICALNPDF